MNRTAVFWALGAGAVVALLYALKALIRDVALDGRVWRFAIAAGLFVAYCLVVDSGTKRSKRSLSFLAQTGLGVLVACVIAGLLGTSAPGYGVAIVVGVFLGFTADKWVKHA